MMELQYRVLELFSGIGGMHFAFQYARLSGDIVDAMDINTVANAVYAHNFKGTKVSTRNIERLSEQDFRKQDVNMLLMSPPCQPHTRLGLQKDIKDQRSNALLHLCELIPQCETLRYILMENVKNFELSQARHIFIKALEKAGFFHREFILSPMQLNVPNTRHRYYCIARKDTDFNFEGNNIWDKLPGVLSPKSLIPKINSILETDPPNSVCLPDRVLNKRLSVMDIVHSNDSNSMCFTKSYTNYSEGTGSIYTPLEKSESEVIMNSVKELENKIETDANKEDMEQQRVELLRQLKLRYFTPREVARLMSFPESFEFPSTTTIRQKYRLLGNSINIRVVGELLKLLTTND